MKKNNYSDINIVLVDDDVNYLSMTKMYLSAEGLRIITYSNPIEALEYIKGVKTDIVLLDYFMPEMTGEEFVRQLRKFNNETLVILQTGFSEEKPPVEMLTNLQIQGYHDKTKGIEDLMLLTLSAIKVINLMKINEKQEKEIHILNYKKEFLGNLITGLINEAKDSVFAINLANKSLQEGSTGLEEELSVIEKATNKLNSLFKALNYDSMQDVTIKDFMETIRELLKCKLKTDLIQLNINIQNSDVRVKENVSDLIYVLCNIVEHLSSKNTKEIDITLNVVDNQNYICITIENEIQNELKDKIILFDLDIEFTQTEIMIRI